MLASDTLLEKLIQQHLFVQLWPSYNICRKKLAIIGSGDSLLFVDGKLYTRWYPAKRALSAMPCISMVGRALLAGYPQTEPLHTFCWLNP